MEQSFDIFLLADFPIIVTDGALKIVFKNTAAKLLLPKLRKSANMGKYLSEETENGACIKTKVINIKGGTHYKRAVLFDVGLSKNYALLFLPRLQFDGYEEFLSLAERKYGTDIAALFSDLYKNVPADTGLPLTSRVNDELIDLIKSDSYAPSFMKKDVVDIAFILKRTTGKLSRSLRAFGVRIFAEAKTLDSAPIFCKTDKSELSFILMRLVYIALRLSLDSRICISLLVDEQNDNVLIDFVTATALPNFNSRGFENELLCSSLPELAFELAMAKHIGKAEKLFFFSAHDGIFKASLTIPMAKYSDILALCSYTPYDTRRTENLIALFARSVRELIKKTS